MARLTMTTKSLALLLLAGLALSQLALPAEAGRPSLRSKDERNQQKREAEQFAAQEATQEAWVAQEQAKLEQQERQEAEKLEEMADVHAVTEAEQLATQQKKLERLAARENAAKAEQEQLAELSREAERRADEAAREKEEKDRRQEEQRQEEERVQAAASDSDASNNDNKEEERSTKGNDNDSFDSNNRGGGDDDASYSDGGSSSGPIWGKYRASGRRGAPGPAYATYHYYAPGYETSSLYCADVFNTFLPIEPDHWLLEYPWTAYCNDKGLGPMTQDKCGKCLQVTNPSTGQSVKTRVVDMCGQGGVDLDPLAFNAIDTNGAGVRDGHMDVELEWC